MSCVEIIMAKKKKKWIKFRHKAFTFTLKPLVYAYTVLKYGLKSDRFKEQGDRQYLIVMNHQTLFDQFFVAFSFKGPVYYIASEDIFSNGFVSKLIKYLVAPIPIKKQTTDIQAVRDCIRVAKEGGTIALAPEGNRTFSGKTEYIKPSIMKLVRVLKLPLAIFRIEGGYGVHPRWSDVVRRGKMHSYVSRVVEPEEYKDLTDDELLELIESSLYVDEGCVSGEFHHKKLAEYLERAAYVCPYCGLSTFESHDDIIECKKCGIKIRYLPTKELEGVGNDFPFRFMTEWYAYQNEYINKLDTNEYVDSPMYSETADLYEVELYKKKRKIREAQPISLYGDRIVIGDDFLFMFDDITAITVQGKNKLCVYHGGKAYQIRGGKRFNALKYMNICFRYKNIKEGNEDGKFLGI